MPIGQNVALKEKLISKTTNKENKEINTNNKNKKGRFSNNENVTEGTKKMTFYVNEDLLEKLYNFAYWDRHSLTEAFNLVLEDGLKGKSTRPKNR